MLFSYATKKRYWHQQYVYEIPCLSSLATFRPKKFAKNFSMPVYYFSLPHFFTPGIQLWSPVELLQFLYIMMQMRILDLFYYFDKPYVSYVDVLRRKSWLAELSREY